MIFFEIFTKINDFWSFSLIHYQYFWINMIILSSYNPENGFLWYFSKYQVMTLKTIFYSKFEVFSIEFGIYVNPDWVLNYAIKENTSILNILFFWNYVALYKIALYNARYFDTSSFIQILLIIRSYSKFVEIQIECWIMW